VKIKSLVPTFFLLLLVAAVAYTAGNKGLPDLANIKKAETKKNDTQSVDKIKQNILSNIQTLDVSVTEIQIEETPIKGIYWVLLPGSETLLISADGRFILGRGINEFKEGKLEPVESQMVELAKVGLQQSAIDAFQKNQEQQIIYKAHGEKKAEVYVFTDVNCGYCRKFHKDVPELNQAGIEVHYFAGPFYSKDRESLEQIWCSKDPLVAMNLVKGGQKLSGVTITEACKTTVSDHIALGQKLGIRGTPALFTKSVEQIGGYVPPQELIARLTKGSEQ